MQSMPGSEHLKSHDSGVPTQHALWSVDLKCTHLDWSPKATLIHFQGQYPSICELDYHILQQELQNVSKTEAAVDIADFCLVEDVSSARWFRGRVQNRKEDLLDVFLIDCGNVLSVDVAHIRSCTDDLFILPPKIVSGFLANVLILQNCSPSVIEGYLSSLIGKNVTGFITALLPHKVVLLEVPNINSDLVRHGFGRHVDRDTFLLLVSLLTEVPLKQNMEPVPDLLIEKSRGQTFCYKSSSLRGYKDILSFCGLKLSFGTHNKVRVTAAVNPGLFYCQMANATAELCQFSKKLAKVCEDKIKGDSQKTPENLGVLCAVKGKDQGWYRGLVQFLPAHSQVRVFFIDYGFFETAKVENVHRLPPEFYSAQIMAFPCQLPSLADQEMPFRTQQLSFLKAGLLGAVLEVEITGFDKENHLYTIKVLSDEDSHVEEPKPIHNLTSEPLSDVVELPPLDRYENYEKILSEALCKTMEAEDVQVGSIFVGYVEYAQDPNHFWIRTQKRNQEFEEMMTKIRDYFSQVKLDEDVLNPEVGAMCCALYEEDMHFYRGVVTDVLEHGAEILFIDYGNIEKVPHKLIKTIPKAIANECPFAICCTLVNVFPLDDVWPSVTRQLFRKAVSSKALLVHLIQMKKNMFVVDLFEMGSNNSITELLISSKLAEYIPHVPVEKNNKDVLEKARQLQHSEANTSKRSEKWQHCEGEVNQCRKETEKVKAHSNYKAINFKPGFEVSVRCSHINSPYDFWCQPLDGTQALEKLMDDIQLYYSAHTVPLHPEDSCCVAKSLQDGKWYRGLVIGNRKSHATVMLVDYGSVIQVRDDHLQAIRPEYLHLEGQAFRCSVANLIEPADPKYCGNWSPHACNLLKCFVLNSQDVLKCKVLSLLNVKNKGLCNVVFLHNTQTQQSITNILIEQGHARVATLSTRQNSDVFPESFFYSSFDLRPGDEEQVYVTHVNSQCEVYCQLKRNTEIIEDLETKISQDSENIMQAGSGAVVRKLCLAKYFDGKWYRGMMLPVQLSLHVGVFFVDYGNTKISEIKSIMSIPRSSEDLLYTPMQAIRFNLRSVPAGELYADALEFLISAVLNKLLKAVVRGKRDDGSFDVELFDGEININEKVKELISTQKPKTAVRCAISNTKTTKDKYKNPQEGQCAASCKTLNGTKINNTKNPLLSRSLNKYARAKKESEHNAKRSGSINPQIRSTSGDQNIKSKDTQKREKSQLVRFPDKTINPGFRAKCFVSHIDSFSSFFLQLSDDESAILKMGKNLNSSLFKDSLKIVSHWSVSDVVLSVFEDDGLYRSVVKNKEDSSRYKVEFVDYGNSSVVEKEKIYPLPEELLSHPRFSIPCSLMNTRAFRDEASFIEAVMDKPLMVEFVRQYGIQWQVNIEVLDGEAGNNIPSSSFVAESKEESPSLLSESTEIQTESPCKENLGEDGHQSEKSREAGSILESKSLMPQPSVKQQVRTSMRVRRTCNRKKIHKKSKTSSVLVEKRGQPDRFLPQTIQVRDTETGTILSVQSNGSFYVRLTKNNNMLTSMERHITNNVMKYKTVPEEDIKQNLKCLVKAEDGQWQRAVIQQTRERWLEVFLVDHGITEDIPIGPVLQQYTYLKRIPNLALLCKMNSLGFSEGKAAHQCWYETLKPLVGTEVRLIFVSFSVTDKVWLVEIVLSGLLLVDQIKASLQQNGEKTTLADETQSEILPDGFTADVSTPQLLFFPPLETDKAYHGFATAVTTPFEFCVVLDDLHLVMKNVFIMLDDLHGNMPPLPEAHLVPGACCLLKSESKNKWCRGEIIHADTMVVLNLVDYGHHECIPYDDFSKLKQLPVELTNLQKTTYPCILRGVKPVGVDGQWTDEAAVFFQHCLYQKNLQIFFKALGSNSTWTVDILTDGVHVAKKLVDAGHANYTDVILGLRFQVLGSCKQPQVCGADEEEVCNEVEATDGCDGNTSVNTEPKSSQLSLATQRPLKCFPEGYKQRNKFVHFYSFCLNFDSTCAHSIELCLVSFKKKGIFS
ncbi:tudor domain-containing protein 15 isoform X1 [Girardinichthys multiradiatus]|uniref:tudor domain-containing protein 15 isoform X1 n=2 Tax=Girardinichthys multiradiatus TaxID=208333 RepID=UPI001FAB5FC4|nr:tudor domain-containing protein 15 isoform X1 [Girardinichthys multiradiatus]